MFSFSLTELGTFDHCQIIRLTTLSKDKDNWVENSRIKLFEINLSPFTKTHHHCVFKLLDFFLQRTELMLMKMPGFGWLSLRNKRMVKLIKKTLLLFSLYS